MEYQNYSVLQKQVKPMTIADWLITFLIQSIPIVGFIMLFVWAFDSNTHPSKKTWAQAILIFYAIIILLIFIIIFFMAGIFINFFEELDFNYST